MLDWRGLRSGAAAALKPMLAGVGRARTLGLAAEMSFWLFLAILPLAAVAGMLAARLVTGNSWLASSILDAVPAQVRSLLAAQLTRVASWNGGAVAPIATATFLWLASSGVHAVFDGLEVQTGVSRPWWRKRLLALAACVMLSLGVAVLTLLGAGLDWLQTVAGAHLPGVLVHVEHGVAGQLVRFALGAVVAVGMVGGLYRVAVPRRGFPVFPGAMVAVLLQALLGWGYGLYVTKLGSRGGAYQAGLAAIGFTMTTLWLFSVALLLGAQLNCVLADRLRRSDACPRSAASSPQPTSPRRRAGPSTGPSSSPHA